MTVNIPDAAQLAAQQAGDVFSRKASGMTRVVSPWTALAYSFVAPNITQASFYLLWAVTLYAGANMQWAIMFMLSLLPFAAIYVYFSASMPRSGGEYIYISRVLTPFLGFIASWTLTIVGLNWQGNNTNYVINWGFGHTFMQFGLIYKNAALFNLGTEMARPQGSVLVWVLGSISLMLSFYVIYRGIKLFMKFVWAAVILTWVMLAVFAGVMLSVNPTIIANGMKLLQNIDYQSVLQQATALGWQRGYFSVAATVMAGVTYMNLTCLGSTYSANIAGEIKRVDKAQPLAQYGSIFLFIIYYQVFTYVTYHGVGIDLLQAISKLNAAGADTAHLQGVPADPLSFGVCHPEPDPAAPWRPLCMGVDQLGRRHGTRICAGTEPVCVFLRRNAAAQAERSQPPRLTDLRRAARLHHFLVPVHCELHNAVALGLPDLYHYDLVLRLDLPEHCSHCLPVETQGHLG